MQIQLTERRLKEMAKTLRAGLPEAARPSYTQSLDLLATVFGYRTFAAMKSGLAKSEPAPAPRPFTVVVADQRAGQRTYSVHQVTQVDAENAGAIARIEAIAEEFPAPPFDDATERRWDEAMHLVEPVMVLDGHADTSARGIWTVVLRAAHGTETGYHTTYVQADDRARAETEAQTNLRWDLAGAQGLWGHDLSVETVVLLPGQLTPAEEVAPDVPEVPRIVLEMEGGIIQALIADRPLKIMRIDEDALEDIPDPEDPDAAREEIEARTPEWGGADAIEAPVRVIARGNAHAARFRRELTETLLDAAD